MQVCGDLLEGGTGAGVWGLSEARVQVSGDCRRHGCRCLETVGGTGAGVWRLSEARVQVSGDYRRQLGALRQIWENLMKSFASLSIICIDVVMTRPVYLI